MKHLPEDKVGCARPDYEAGEAKLGLFSVKDKLKHDNEKAGQVVTKRQ